MVITVQDIGWLRRAAHKLGTEAIPSITAAKLMGAQLIKPHGSKGCMKITKRGELALARLG